MRFSTYGSPRVPRLWLGRWRLRLQVLAIVGYGLVAVPPSPAVGPLVAISAAQSAATSSPRFNEVWSMGVHNSYYFAPPDFEAYGRGPAQHLLDDFYSDRMKSFEFDLHPDPDQKDAFNPEGRWGVYHTNKARGDSTVCTFLNLCLNVMRAYHFANADHDPVVIRLEAKGTFLDGNGANCGASSILFPGCLFRNGMTPMYLDDTLTKYLHDGQAGVAPPPGAPVDDWIFGPKDYYRWCQDARLPELVAAGSLPVGTTLDLDNLKDAVGKCGWPTVDELKGKFILNLFGSDPLLVTQNALSVNLYSHGFGRRISDVKIFPEASVVGSNIIFDNEVNRILIDYSNPPSCPSGVCNWNNHSVFAEISGDMTPAHFACHAPLPPDGEDFPCLVDPVTGSHTSDPGLVLSNFVLGGGIVKSDDATTQEGMAAALRPIRFDAVPGSLGGVGAHGFNLVGAGDAPRNMVVNFRPADVAKPEQVDGPLNWSYGCLWDSTTTLLPGCPTGALSEQHGDISVKVAPSTTYMQLTDHVPVFYGRSDVYADDNIVFLNVERDPGSTASLKAFVSTRRARFADGTDDFGPTNAGNLGCLMARADNTDATAPFFGVCRYGHRNGGEAFGVPPSNEGLYTFYRLSRGGPIQAGYSDANPHPTGNEPITHQGQWELQPSLRIQPDPAGTCWSGFSRSTDDPAPEPGWGEVSVGPTLCFAEPLNFVGFASDGGREFADDKTGEHNFAEPTYGGVALKYRPEIGVIAGRSYLRLSMLGDIRTPVIEDRSYRADHTPPVLALPASQSVDATTPAGAVVTFSPTATDDDDTTPLVTCVPSSGTFPVGSTTVTCSATDLAGNTATGTFVVTVRGAADQLRDLSTRVQGTGPGKSLAAKVANALAAVERGSTAACGQLAAFITEARAQSGKGLTVTQADRFVADASRIRAVIGCT